MLEYPGGFFRNKDYEITPALYTFGHNRFDRTNRVIHPGGFNTEPPLYDLRGRTVLCGGVVSHYGHTFVDLIDRLHGHLGEIDKIDFFLIDSPQGPDTIDELIDVCFPELKGVPKLYSSNGTYYNGRFIVLPNRSNKTAWSMDTVRFLQDAFSRAIKTQSTTEVLYLMRGPALERAILNEEDVINHFLRAGATVVEPGSLSFHEQISHFASASLVVGTIGSQLFNLFACKPGMKVVAFVPSGYFEAEGDNVRLLKDLCAKLKLELTFIPMTLPHKKVSYAESGYIDTDLLP